MKEDFPAKHSRVQGGRDKIDIENSGRKNIGGGEGLNNIKIHKVILRHTLMYIIKSYTGFSQL